MLIKPLNKKFYSIPGIAPYYKTAGAGFTPASLTGALVWLKADAGVTLSGSDVTQWTDQISGIAFTPQTGAPTFSATGFNTSFPGIIFTKAVTSGLASGLSAVSFGAGNNLGSFAAVLNWGASSNADALFGYLATGDASETGGANSVSIRFLSGPNMQIVHASSGFTNDAFTGGTNLRMSWVFDGTNETSFFNNVQQTQSAINFNFGAAGSGNGGLCVGNYLSSTFAANVTISEVVVTKAALSSTDRTNLDNYFRSKWGL